ncbi:collectin-11-like [Branchiostoma lanceolatum]|uniref:collectin-11-like n=1 Tax=Branchiostoma lanceolatum TaxID=7740 RepID=UPI00345318B5
MTEPSGKTGPILPGDARANGPFGPPGPSGPPGLPDQPAVPLSAGPTYPNPAGPPERHQTNIRGKSYKVSCPGGYTEFCGICYKMFKTMQTFSEASATCRTNGGTLAMPRDAQINDFLISLYRKSVNNMNSWFGLHGRREEGKFEWVDGSPLGEYNFWGKSQPEKGPLGRMENCIRVNLWDLIPPTELGRSLQETPGLPDLLCLLSLLDFQEKMDPWNQPDPWGPGLKSLKLLIPEE